MAIIGPPKGVEVPFEPVHEGWSIYKMKDGAVIKMKIVLLKLVLTDVDELGNPRFAGGSNMVFVVSVPPEMKQAPNPAPFTQKQIEESVVERDIPFDTVKEEWNDYKVGDIALSIKPVATVVSRTSLVDINGDPVYNVQYQPIIKSTAGPQAKRRFLRLKREGLGKVK